METLAFTIGRALTLQGVLSAVPLGSAASFTLTAAGGTPPYRITRVSDDFPPEWTLDDTGTDTVELTTSETAVAGTFSVTYRVKDADRTVRQVTRSLRVIEVPLSISGALAAATVGSVYADTLDVAGGVGDYNIIVADLPPGLSASLADGVDSPLTISGTPTGLGLGPGTSFTFDVTIAVEDSEGNQAVFEQSMTLNVTAVTASFSSLPDGTDGDAYSGDANATGGTGGYTFTLEDGPSWMSINATTGALSGTAEEGTAISVTVRATDSEGNWDEVTDTFDVTVAFVPATWNPSDKSAELTLSGSDLIVTNTSSLGNGFEAVRANGVCRAVDRTIFEIVVTTGATSPFMTLGLSNGTQALSGVTSAIGNDTTGPDTRSYGYYQETGQKYHLGALSGFGTALTTGDVLGVEYDGPNQEIKFWKNGTLVGTAFTASDGVAGDLYPAAALWRRDAPAHVLTLRADPSTYAYPYSGSFVGVSQ